MRSTHIAPSSDLPAWVVALACGLALASFVLLIIEMRRRERGGIVIAATGLIALLALLTAVLRPVRIDAHESVVGAKVVVLAYVSRSMALEDGARKRRDARDAAALAIAKANPGARIRVLGFG